MVTRKAGGMLKTAKPRVLFFIPTMEVGGAERVCLNLVNNLMTHQPVLLTIVKRGFLLRELQPHVLLTRPLLPSWWDLSPRRKSLRSAYLFSLLWLGPSYLFSLLWQARRLTCFARQNGCAVVASFITLPNLVAILAKVFFDRRLKVVVNVHDITSEILRHSALLRYEQVLLEWMVRITYRQADLIVAVARGIKSDLVKHFLVAANKCVVINNPVDVQLVRDRTLEPVTCPFLEEKGALVVAVGRLVKLKGFDLLIQAFAKLPPEVNARLLIIGEGEEHLALEHLIAQLGLRKRIVLLGYQDNPWKYMARADVFVLSSLTEGFPLVIGEALALGLPILSTNCSPGVEEYLQAGKSGILVAPGDVTALAQGLQDLLTDDELRQQLRQEGRKRIENLDVKEIVRLYELALDNVIRK